MIAIAAMTSPAVAGFERNRDFQREIPEPAIDLTHADPSRAPDRYDYPRQPFTGVRAVVDRLVHGIMPSVPTGPPKVVATRPNRQAGLPAVQPIRAASVYTPIQGSQQTSPWYAPYTGNDLESF
jgi:hypothetical protein